MNLRRRSRGRGQGIRSVVPPAAGRQVATGGACPRQRPPTGESFVERAAKAEMITELKAVFKTAQTVVVAHYAGLTVSQMQNLRKQAKQSGTKVKVAKNRLAKIALEGTDVASIGPLLKGPTLIAFSGDPVAATKVVVDFAKGHDKLVILGGAMGKTTLDANGVKALAALPSLDQLRAKIAGLLVAPATKIAQLMNAPGAQLARVVQAYANKG
jgi:large subunit ribosomal protein L10